MKRATRAYDVLAMTVDRHGDRLSDPRTERINTTNPIFAGATGPWDVEDRFNAFWNRLNDSWERNPPDMRVVVVSVTEVH